ncbi:hypothetical protein V494_00090 [Pseudogymnoascus sp. VKM F-4513 (FW-928)]|nr:hypothetical protein V494_00090 [Pseudogymnoascus sp. VKM F-4513 (FW-928)]
MEIASAAIGVVGLAGLYSTCIGTLDALSSAARYGINREILQTKIEVERIRLMVWGESVGLSEIDFQRPDKNTNEDDLAVLDESLQRTALRTAVAGLLTCIANTFEDVEALQKRYGLAIRRGSEKKENASAISQRPTREILLATFQKTYSRFQERTTVVQKETSPFKKAMWAVTDESKFLTLVAELRAINDSLASLLPAIRDKTRVNMRTQIMQSNDVGQLQSLVTAADDVMDLVAETASLRLEMLSVNDQNEAQRPPSRVVQLAAPQTHTAVESLTSPRSPSPVFRSVVQGLVAAVPSLRPETSQSRLDATPGPSDGLYDDTGALVIHRAYNKPNSLACFSWLTGLGDVPELSEDQHVPEPFVLEDMQFVSSAISSIADKLFEIDPSADRKYAGWSPGSTSLTGFARETTYWKAEAEPDKKEYPSWHRARSIGLPQSFIYTRWKESVEEGLGEGFTDRKGYDRVLELIGPSEFTWVDPEEGFKLRHQIRDLLAALSTTIVPSLKYNTIGQLAFRDKLEPHPSFDSVDVLRQLLLAREAMLRIQHTDKQWYGGVTISVILDIIAADLWARNMPIKSEFVFEAPEELRRQQLDGMVRFVDEMLWPYAHEVREAVDKLHRTPISDMNVGIHLIEWMSGIILPGSRFPFALFVAIYSLSPTLRSSKLSPELQFGRGNYGIVYPESSYWNYRSVLGKVLAPLSHCSETENARTKCLAGWVGPCLSPNLPQSGIGIVVSLSSRPSPFVPLESDNNKSNAPQTAIPTSMGTQGQGGEWILPTPPKPSSDTVALQTIRLSKIPGDGTGVGEKYLARLDFRLVQSRTFATLTLYTNSIFVAAPPCRGTHRVYPHSAGHYTFSVLGVEDLAQLPQKGGAAGEAIAVVNATGSPVNVQTNSTD